MSDCNIYGCKNDPKHTFWDSTHGEKEHFCTTHSWLSRFPEMAKRTLYGENDE